MAYLHRMNAIHQNPVLGWFVAVMVGLFLLNVGPALTAWMSTPAGHDAVGRAVAWTIGHTLFKGHAR